MVMHRWGDEGVDWKGISDAAEYISHTLRHWGRISCIGKEKWGTVRISFIGGFGCSSLLSLTHPGWYYYGPYPDWLMDLDISHGYKLGILLNWFLIPYQERVYRYAYRTAISRWPHLTREILVSVDYPELLIGIL